ncbi:glycosyltransferase [Aestuariibacter salexigens]|uniref:glycosyltransferase n=1 Tax=Aestuariibacter salexigens TaxID=226010 RepID=UPI00040BB33A|nr:glycosyltransferase [Aestuariibacter salexigens]
MKLHLLVLNWNDYEATKLCIKSIYGQLNRDVTLSVVDNGSTKYCLRKLDTYIATLCSENIELISLPSNLGYSRGFNNAIKHHSRFAKSANYFWFLNNDTELHLNTIPNVIEFIKSTPSFKSKLIGTVLVNKTNNKVMCFGGVKYNSWLGYDSPLLKNKEVSSLSLIEHNTFSFDYLHGASFLIRSSDFLSNQGFDERYFLYFEELSLSKLFKPSEMSICANALVYHVDNNMAKKSNKLRDICGYHAALSCFRFTSEYYPFKLPSVMITRLLYRLLLATRERRFSTFHCVAKASWDFVFNNHVRRSFKKSNER